MLEKYTVTLRGESFTLYRDQIEFDAPNYFTDLFLGDFSESQSRSVELSRSPVLFGAIVDYLSGYNIFPLTAAVVPPTMTPAVARENLLRDAEFYGLQGLVKLLTSAPTPPRFSTACDAFLLGRQAVDFEDVVQGKLPLGVIFDERGVGTMNGEAWLAAPILALNTLLVAEYAGNSYRPRTMALASALGQQFLASNLADRYQPTASTTLRIGSLDRKVLPCSVASYAHVSVEGVGARGDELMERMEALNRTARDSKLGAEHAIDAPLREIRRQEGHRYIFMGEKIIFTVTAGAAETPMQVVVLAAHLTSRSTAAQNFL